MAWVVDKGLDVLLAQINAAAPGRDKSSDGSIGDADHSARTSDHNPQSPPPPGNPDDQVDARDFTHDPDAGADMAVVAESIRLSEDKRVRYVIWHQRIFYSTARNGYAPWAWQPHTGDYHPHLHVSVNDVHHDVTTPWQIGIDMGLTAEEAAEIIGGKLTKRNVLHWRIRSIQDSEDPLLAATYPDWDVPAPGLKQIDARLSDLEQAPPGTVDLAVLAELVRRVVREELDKTKLAGG